MSVSQLSVISTQPESPAARARRLMAEAKAAAEEQVQALEAALLNVAHLSAEIADGGDAYSPGVREVCRKLVDEAVWGAQTLDAMVRQVGAAKRR